MGVVNVTPDSFSDSYPSTAVAVRQGLLLLGQGADLLDVGGESTRPGASRVEVDDELRRVLPVVEQLAAAGAVVSVDTTRATVARAAVEAGARLVNDISGGLADDAMLALVAELAVPYVVMHWRGHSIDMQSRARYADVVGEVRDELSGRLEACGRAGIDPARVLLDPGLGFAKTGEHSWALLADLPSLQQLGRPLLVGASRKRFLGELLGSPDEPRPTGGRDAATAAVTVLAAQAGAWAVRVHDVAPSADAVRVIARVSGAGSSGVSCSGAGA